MSKHAIALSRPDITFMPIFMYKVGRMEMKNLISFYCIK